MDKSPENQHCPVCGFYCLGKGGAACIDKPALVARAALAEPVGGEPVAWMIECNNGFTGWWCGHVRGGLIDCRFFDKDPNKAVVFPSKESAESVIQKIGHSCMRATSHQWMLPSTRPAPAPAEQLRRGVTGVCTKGVCECEREGYGDKCIWLRPTDAELERRTGEPHIDGYPLYSGLPPPAERGEYPPADFEAWWAAHGQFVRAGGGDYEKSFAFAAWNAAVDADRAQRVPLTDERVRDAFMTTNTRTVDQNFSAFRDGVRYAERANGIGAKP